MASGEFESKNMVMVLFFLPCMTRLHEKQYIGGNNETNYFFTGALYRLNVR